MKHRTIEERAKRSQRNREWREKNKAKLAEYKQRKYQERKVKEPNYIPFKITRKHIVLFFE